MVYFTYFNNRLATYQKIYMFNFVIANGLRSRPLRIVFLSTVKLYHRHINLNISFAVNANSTFQLVKRSSNQGTRKLKCIQFTHPNTGAKYALKVVNQSRVVFEVCRHHNHMQRINVQLNLHPGDTQRNFISTGRLRSPAQPPLHTIFEGKDTPFVSWYPFHIPGLELCFSFNCCKCIVFKIYETITKPERFLDFFHSH